MMGRVAQKAGDAGPVADDPQVSDAPARPPNVAINSGLSSEISLTARLQRDLQDARHQLEIARRDLELANAEHKADSEKATSVNQGHQSTNDELTTSNAQLQALNDDLTALNGQLHEMVAQQQALEAAKLDAETVEAGKSRFLIAASHDLRQPLQTMSFLQVMLEKRIHDATTLTLVRRLDDTVRVMAGMLDRLPEAQISPIQQQGEHESAKLVAAIVPIGDLAMERLRDTDRHSRFAENELITADLLRGLVPDLPGKVGSARSSAGPIPVSRVAEPVATVYVIDDDSAIRLSLADLLRDNGYAVELYADGHAFLKAVHQDRSGCVLVDAIMPGMSGIELMQHLKSGGYDLPAIIITGSGAISMAVTAMKAGAVDFIEKPVGVVDLLGSIERALELSKDIETRLASRDTAATQVASLTVRQRQILDLVLAGHPSKNIAADLGISQRTVDNHRAAIMRKTGSKSVPALVRTALAAF